MAATRHLLLEDAPAAVAPPGPRLAPAVEIRIWLERDSAANAARILRFELTAPARELQEKPFGPQPLSEDLRGYFERFYGQIAFAGGGATETLTALCAELADLFPAELHEHLWALKDRGLALWLRPEDEAWIPWEILPLRGKEGGRRVRGPFLCEAFQVTRWPAGVYCRSNLPVRSLAAVLAEVSDLPALAEERRFLEELHRQDRSVEFLPPSRAEVLAAMDTRSFDVWHIASHGEWSDGDPSAAVIRLSSRESITLRDVTGAACNFCHNHPLVVLNACELGRGGRGLVSWAGWTARLVQMEAGAVLSALWSVDDRAAVLFIRSFYEAFLGGAPLAQAVYQARRATRETYPEESTWLAFTVSGHPLAVCTTEPVAVPAPAQVAPVENVPLSRWEGGRRERGIERVRSRRLPRTAAVVLLLLLPAFALLGGVRTETRVQLDLTARRVAFTVGGAKASPLTDSNLSLQSLTVAGLSQADLSPRDLSRLDARGEWQPVVPEPTTAVSLLARGPGAQVSVEGTVTLDRLWVDPGSRIVVQAVGHPQGFDLGLEVPCSGSLDVRLYGSFALSADGAEVQGLKPEPGGALALQSFLRGRLREDRPALEIFPGGKSLQLSGALRPLAEVPLLRRSLPLTTVLLFDQDADGALQSTLVGDGRLRYPDQPWKSPVTLGVGDLLVLEDLRDFQLSRLDLIPQGGPLRITLAGWVREARSGRPGLVRDLRLSLYEKWLEPLWRRAA